MRDSLPYNFCNSQNNFNTNQLFLLYLLKNNKRFLSKFPIIDNIPFLYSGVKTIHLLYSGVKTIHLFIQVSRQSIFLFRCQDNPFFYSGVKTIHFLFRCQDNPSFYSGVKTIHLFIQVNQDNPLS